MFNRGVTKIRKLINSVENEITGIYLMLQLQDILFPGQSVTGEIGFYLSRENCLCWYSVRQ